MTTAASTFHSADTAGAPAPSALRWRMSACLAVLVGLLTPFTVSLVGEMPVAEPILIALAGWTAVCTALHQARPGRLFYRPLFWWLLAAQAVALAAYVASDFYRGSSPHDMARGWGRMIFLGIDVIAITYLFSCSRHNLLWFVLGATAGACGSLFTGGAMFGDLWKFGLGAPVTFLALVVIPRAGPWLASAAFIGLAAVHLVLDYRSYAALCAVASLIPLIQLCSPRARLWLAPLALAIGAVGIVVAYDQLRPGTRATRSDIERTAMITAAAEAFQSSPVIGHGSWFSNTKVYENFMVLRHEAAKRAHVGGFAHPNQTPDSMALHSQILVALAEGGLFGGAFFFVYGLALFWGFGRVLLIERWNSAAPLQAFLLLTALWNLGCSPFSGAQRIWISVACGLVLLLQAGPETTDEEVAQ